MKRFAASLLGLALLALPAEAATIRHVVVIAMENKDSVKAGGGTHNFIYGNTGDAPWINGVFAGEAARADNFADELSAYNSQPHYMLMEAGTNKFADTVFTCDNDPLQPCGYLSRKPNWTRSSDHLAAQIEAAGNPKLTWMTYQEDIDPRTTGACPIHSAGLYATKHNPFVYFADVSGAPPSADDARCAAHTRDLSRFAADLRADAVASYVFVTPNLCHDMHGAGGCGANDVRNGDDFLKSFLPPLLAWAKTHDAVVFVTWDEGRKGLALPFYAAGMGVRAGYRSHVRLSHRSIVRTVERIFSLPVLDSVKGASDLADLFEPGALP